MESFIDKTFRGYGERDFGKKLMDTVSSKQLEAFRCETFKALDSMTKQFGKQPKGTAEALFYFMLLEHFEKAGAINA